MRRIRFSFDPRKFYGKIITSLFLVSFASVIVLGIFATFYSKGLINRYHIESASEKVDEISNAVNIIVGEVQSDGVELSRSAMATDYYRFVNGDYYEHITGAYSSADLLGLYDYLKAKNKIMSSMSNLTGSTEYIDSIYLFDYRKNIVLTNTFETYAPSQFYDREWLSAMEGDESGRLVLNMGIREINLPAYPATQVLTLIYPDKSFTRDGVTMTSALVINIDTKVLFDMLFKDLLTNPDDLFWIENGEGQTILNSRVEFTDLRPIDMAGEDVTGSIGVTAGDGDEYTIVTKRSGVFDWTIVVGLMNDTITGNISRLIQFMILLVVVVLLIDVVITLLLGGRLYSPVQTIIEAVRKHSKDDIPDDLGNITDSIIHTMVQNEELKSRLEESIPAYRASYIRSLLHNNAVPRANIQRMFDNIGINLMCSDLYVVMIAPQFDGSEPIKEGVYDFVKLKHMIYETLSASFSCFIMEDHDNRYAVVVNAVKDQQSELFDVLYRIHRFMGAKLSRECNIGISGCCEHAGMLYAAYNEAVAALNYSLLSHDESMVFIADIIAEDNRSIAYPEEKEELLLLCIKNGRPEEARQLFDEMMMTLISTCQTSSQTLRIHMIRLLSRLLNTNEEMPGEFCISMKDAMNALEDFNKYEMIDWFRGTILSLANMNTHTAESLRKQNVEAIMDIVNQNLGGDMTLTYISAIMNLSPTYISRIFKQETGLSFVEYVTARRITCSKELLVNTELSIREISEQLGYSNSQYFIKLFKGDVGITPGQYRKARSPGANHLAAVE